MGIKPIILSLYRAPILRSRAQFKPTASRSFHWNGKKILGTCATKAIVGVAGVGRQGAVIVSPKPGDVTSHATALVGGNASEEEDSCFEKKAQTLQSHAKQGTAALASDLVKP